MTPATRMRRIEGLVIHCAATRPSMDIGEVEIRRWHTDPEPVGRGWADIGYHHIIRRDGRRETARDEAIAGAHVSGHNARTIGICLVGGVDDAGKPANNFTEAQFSSLIVLLGELALKYPGAWIKGHRDLFAGKACPSFDVARWLAAGQPAAWTGEP